MLNPITPLSLSNESPHHLDALAEAPLRHNPSGPSLHHSLLGALKSSDQDEEEVLEIKEQIKKSRLDRLPGLGHLRLSGAGSIHKGLRRLVYHNPEFENFTDNVADAEKVLSKRENILKINRLGGLTRLDRLKMLRQLKAEGSAPLTKNDKSDFKKILKHFSRQ